MKYLSLVMVMFSGQFLFAQSPDLNKGKIDPLLNKSLIDNKKLSIEMLKLLAEPKYSISSNMPVFKIENNGSMWGQMVKGFIFM